MSPMPTPLPTPPSTEVVQAPDLARALELVRTRFGPEALIVETRRVEGPDGEDQVEVVLAPEEGAPGALSPEEAP